VTIEIVQGDIYTEETDSIVNMKANSNLDLEGQDRAKYVNAKECKQFIQNNGSVKTGACGVSSGDGKVKSKRVIHAVPPIFKNFSQKNNENLLTALMINILEMARS
jgi:O-acetyl-ADP-ribose deacetylase (regulator of RNase III)